MSEPELLILDEPFDGLDVQARAQLMATLEQLLQKQGEAVVGVAEVEPQPRWRGAGPITGRMSGRHGRRPSHGVSSVRSPKAGNSLRAVASQRPSWIWLPGALAASNSMPVVSRTPRAIGAST